MQDFGLYVIITSPQLSYKKIAEICVAKQVKMLQLREKHLADRELVKISREIAEITRGTDTNFVINDRPDIAALTDADFVHLGQDDISMSDACQIAPNAKFGLSTHSLAQAATALVHQPDYIGFGPIYPTPTKQIADPAVGTDLLKQVLQISTVPVVALGGIFPENLPKVLAAGAKNVALVRYLMESVFFGERIDEINAMINESR